MYWKLNDKETYIEYDYPRDMSIWQGVPLPLDSAFQHWDGKWHVTIVIKCIWGDWVYFKVHMCMCLNKNTAANVLQKPWKNIGGNAHFG